MVRLGRTGRITATIGAAWITTLAIGVWAAAGCSEERTDGFTDGEWRVLRTLSPQPPPADPAPSPELVAFGAALFADKELSGPILVGDGGTGCGLGAIGETGRVACADCHNPEAAFVDVRSCPNATSLGTGWTRRNSPTLLNVALQDVYLWSGKYDSLGPVHEGPLEGPDLMNSDRLAMARLLRSKYLAEYEAAFPGKTLDPRLETAELPPNARPGTPEWDALAPADQDMIDGVMDDFGVALGAFEETLVTGPSPFDEYVAGDLDAISDRAKRGLALFIGKGLCVECHRGPLLSDQGFHNLGLPQRGEHVPAVDLGRALITGDAADDAKFRTPSLRNVGLTPPYMHTGEMETLADVVWFYNEGGGTSGVGQKHEFITPLGLDTTEQEDLVLFLETLTGTLPSTP